MTGTECIWWPLPGAPSKSYREEVVAPWETAVRDPGRLAALTRSGLVGTGPEDAFDRLTELAALVIGAPRAFITLVDAQRYSYKSTVGLADGAPRSGLVEQSFCRYVVGAGRPLIVEDARRDERTWDNPAIALHGVAAWAGYPVRARGGEVLGTFCVVDAVPHRWTEVDIQVLATLAQAASTEVALRMAEADAGLARLEVAALRAGTWTWTGSRVGPFGRSRNGAAQGRTDRSRQVVVKQKDSDSSLP